MTDKPNMKPHQKMCWNCDGHVHVYEMQCPYCGADLTEHEEYKEEAPEQEETVEESYDEPHSATQETEEDDDFTRPPFQDLMDEERVDLKEEEEAWEKAPEEKGPDCDNPVASLLLLLPGTLFFLFGAALFFFSKEGYLVFRFNAQYWFVYLIGSWAMLYLGWRSLFPAKSSRSK